MSLFTAIDKIWNYVIDQNYTKTQLQNAEIRAFIANNKTAIGLTVEEITALKHSSRSAKKALLIKYELKLKDDFIDSLVADISAAIPVLGQARAASGIVALMQGFSLTEDDKDQLRKLI